jgi:soluble lytic murein transglycosylase-like protein
MLRGLAAALWLALSWSVTQAAERAERPTSYDELIAQLAVAHGVPESFVHRVVKRESRYRPDAVNRRCFGLMQLKHATARSMGYDGSPRGLLDPRINLTYGIPYLANAYKIAEGDADLAVRLYASGYYRTAKRKNMLGELRTAASEPLVSSAAVDPAASGEPSPPQSPFGALFSFAEATPYSPPVAPEQ